MQGKKRQLCEKIGCWPVLHVSWRSLSAPLTVIANTLWLHFMLPMADQGREVEPRWAETAQQFQQLRDSTATSTSDSLSSRLSRAGTN